MKKEEAYSLLEIEENATEEQIKKAFRKKAVETHPDKNPNNENAEVEFKKINQAYRILLNLEDSEDHKCHQNFNENFDDFSSVFRRQWQDIFGASNVEHFYTNYKNNTNYKNVKLSVQISFFEAVFGGKKEIEYNRSKFCLICNGRGINLNSVKKCNVCNGSGIVQKIRKTQFVTQIVREPCQKCKQTGTMGDPCSSCNGVGHLNELKKITVQIPPIGQNQTTLRIKQEGNHYPEGKTDLFLNIVPTTVYENLKIIDCNILVKQKVPLNILLFGGELKFKMLEEELSIKIPSKTDLNNQFKISNKGVRKGKYQKDGDVFVELEIEYPSKLSEDLKQILEKVYKEEKNA